MSTSEQIRYIEVNITRCSCGVNFSPEAIDAYHNLTNQGIVGQEAYERVLRQFSAQTKYEITGPESVRMCCANTLAGSRSVFATTVYGILPPEMDSYPDNRPFSKYQEVDPNDIEHQNPQDYESEEPESPPESKQTGITVKGFKLNRQTNKPIKVMIGFFNGKPIEVRVLNTFIPGVPGFSGSPYADEI